MLFYPNDESFRERFFSEEGKNKTDKNPGVLPGKTDVSLGAGNYKMLALLWGLFSENTHSLPRLTHTCVCKHKEDRMWPICTGSVCVFLYGQEVLVFCLREQGA